MIVGHYQTGRFYAVASQRDDEVSRINFVIWRPHKAPHFRSVTLGEVFFSWGDLDAVIETGMPQRTIDASTLHGVVGSHLAEELRGFAVFIVHF